MLTYPIRQVKVGGRTIKIVQNKALTDSWGQFSHDRGLIELGPDVQTPKQFLDTVEHEMLHAALATSGLSSLISQDVEEAIVRAVENIFLPAQEQLHQRLGIRKRK